MRRGNKTKRESTVHHEFDASECDAGTEGLPSGSVVLFGVTVGQEL